MNALPELDWPTISVIIPAWNCTRYLDRALDSVLGQQYPHDRLDVIVVDDGSTDDTAALADRRAAADPRVRVLRQANAGPAAARNRGIDATHGELVAFLDADDTWQPTKLAEQAALYARDRSLGLIHCGVRFVDADGVPVDNWVRRLTPARGDILLEFVCDFFLITSAVIVPRRCIEAVGAFDESLRVGEDNDLFLRLVSRYRVECAEAPLLNRTIRPDSLSREDFDLDARNDLRILDRFLERNPELLSRHRDRIDARYASYLYDYGYRLLESGDTTRARSVFLRSLKRRPSIAAAKAWLRSSLPERAVQLLRSGA